jgi:hypothetical protein
MTQANLPPVEPLATSTGAPAHKNPIVRLITGPGWIHPDQQRSFENAILALGGELSFLNLIAGQGPYNLLEERLALEAQVTVLVSAMLWEHLSSRYPESLFPNAAVVTRNPARRDGWPVKASAVVMNNAAAARALKAAIPWLLSDPTPASRSTSEYLCLLFGWVHPSPAQEAYALRAWDAIASGFRAESTLPLADRRPEGNPREVYIIRVEPWQIKVQVGADLPPVVVSKHNFLRSAVQFAKSRATGAPLLRGTWGFEPEPCTVELLAALEHDLSIAPPSPRAA